MKTIINAFGVVTTVFDEQAERMVKEEGARYFDEEKGIAVDAPPEELTTTEEASEDELTTVEPVEELTTADEAPAEDVEEAPQMTLEEARAAYKEKFGKAPHKNAKLETILAKLNA